MLSRAFATRFLASGASAKGAFSHSGPFLSPSVRLARSVLRRAGFSLSLLAFLTILCTSVAFCQATGTSGNAGSPIVAVAAAAPVLASDDSPTSSGTTTVATGTGSTTRKLSLNESIEIALKSNKQILVQ